jgi:hypothetical protein
LKKSILADNEMTGNIKETEDAWCVLYDCLSRCNEAHYAWVKRDAS